MSDVVAEKDGIGNAQAPGGVSAASSVDAGLASNPSVIPAKRSRSEIPDSED